MRRQQRSYNSDRMQQRRRRQRQWTPVPGPPQQLLRVNIFHAVEWREIFCSPDGREVVLFTTLSQPLSGSLTMNAADFQNNDIAYRAISTFLHRVLQVPLCYLHGHTLRMMDQIRREQRTAVDSQFRFSLLDVRPLYLDDELEIQVATRESEAEFERSNNYGMVPTDPAAVRVLKPVKVESESESCTICMEEFSGSSAVSMPCDHFFHRKCIVKWLASGHYCPICRYEMPTNAQNIN